jgi:release factor glutamine methyltransferase
MRSDVRERLERAGIENAAHEARLLCERFAGDALQEAVERRERREPLQYILGEWGFWRESYEVSPHCLVPRPDTEHLVEKAVRELPRGARFLDLCTGSGCVAISTLASRPDTQAVAVDLFPETADIARRNAVKNGVADRLLVQCFDVLAKDLPREWGMFDAILSNPPYIRADVMDTLSDEVKQEPFAALCGGTDGLDFYRAILENWTALLKVGGFVCFEIGYDQADALRALAAAYGFDAVILRDFGGNDRVAYLTPRQ